MQRARKASLGILLRIVIRNKFWFEHYFWSLHNATCFILLMSTLLFYNSRSLFSEQMCPTFLTVSVCLHIEYSVLFFVYLFCVQAKELPTYKDNDFINDGQKIYIDGESKKIFLEKLRKDVEVNAMCVCGFFFPLPPFTPSTFTLSK